MRDLDRAKALALLTNNILPVAPDGEIIAYRISLPAFRSLRDAVKSETPLSSVLYDFMLLLDDDPAPSWDVRSEAPRAGWRLRLEQQLPQWAAQHEDLLDYIEQQTLMDQQTPPIDVPPADLDLDR